MKPAWPAASVVTTAPEKDAVLGLIVDGAHVTCTVILCVEFRVLHALL
jgi:hypothetical protein